MKPGGTVTTQNRNCSSLSAKDSSPRLKRASKVRHDFIILMFFDVLLNVNLSIILVIYQLNTQILVL